MGNKGNLEGFLRDSLKNHPEHHSPVERFELIGSGELGGKAKSLIAIRDTLSSIRDNPEFTSMEIDIPQMLVLRTGIFQTFMDKNNLWELAYSEAQDSKIATGFLRAEIPFEAMGPLRKWVADIRKPLAVRSSSLLEDAKFEPFAGIYGTKMIPNNQLAIDSRFLSVIQAIKFVYASTFFTEAKEYMAATRHDIREERMGVIVQEVIGEPHNGIFYPEVSGVARSYNFYPTGRSKPEQGVVNLAFGLGKTIVDGGLTWNYSPAHPAAPPPFGSVDDMMKLTQRKFWSIHLGARPSYNPAHEAEFLSRYDIARPEKDGTLKHVASTLDAHSGNVTMGVGRDGPRILNFGPLLNLSEIPFNKLIKALLSTCESFMNTPVEMEFALCFNPSCAPEKKARFGFLQVRPMVVSKERVEIEERDMSHERSVIYSKSVLGNGIQNDIADIVYVKPEGFEARNTPLIAREINQVNLNLVKQDKPYLLIGFGRWGSSDSWLGIPVTWSQICGAKTIVEASLPQMIVDPSQGSHFFHNLTSFGVHYFSVAFEQKQAINWTWLQEGETVYETDFIRHIRLAHNLEIRVDGYRGWGCIKARNGD